MGIINAIFDKSKTDEEVYNMLKDNPDDEDLMDAEEWKKLRMKELNRTGKSWTKKT